MTLKMVFKIGFELYINVNSLKMKVTYKCRIKCFLGNNLNIKSIHFNHYHYGDDFFLGRYNFHSTKEFEYEIFGRYTSIILQV